MDVRTSSPTELTTLKSSTWFPNDHEITIAGLERKRRLQAAVHRGLVAAAITWGARTAFVDQSGPVPLLVATARSGQSFRVAVTGDAGTWLRAAAAVPTSPEADDAGLLRYLNASEKVRSEQSLSQCVHHSPTEALHHVIEHTRLAA